MSTGRLGAGDTAIQPTILDAKGDLIVATAADTPARLAVGSANQVLTVDSSTATGLKWATPSAGSNWSSFGSATLTGATTITVSGISGANKILLLINSASSASGLSGMRVRLNTDTGSNYYVLGAAYSGTAAYSAGVIGSYNEYPNTYIELAQLSANAGSTANGYLLIDGCNAAGVKQFNGTAGVNRNGDDGHKNNSIGGYYNSSSTITSISLVSSSGNFDNGTMYVFTTA